MDALLGAVWLYSADFPRAIAFYRDVVGLTVVDDIEQEVERLSGARLPEALGR